jgi:hypothetical protein
MKSPTIAACTTERRENKRLIRKVKPLFLEAMAIEASFSLARASLKLFICSQRASF